MKFVTSIGLVICFMTLAACHPTKVHEKEAKITTHQITILLHDDISPKALSKDIPELTIKSRTNRTLNEWLFECATSTHRYDELLNEIKNSRHVSRVEINQ